MIVLAYALAYAGFLALSLAMSRHYKDLFKQAPTPRRERLLRVGGWAALAGSFAASVAYSGWQVGSVLSVALLTAGAGTVVLLTSYRPRYLLALAGALLPLSLIAAIGGV